MQMLYNALLIKNKSILINIPRLIQFKIIYCENNEKYEDFIADW
jgi:hypothetical protein